MDPLAQGIARLQQLHDLTRVGLDHGNLTSHPCIGHLEFQRITFPQQRLVFPRELVQAR